MSRDAYGFERTVSLYIGVPTSIPQSEMVVVAKIRLILMSIVIFKLSPILISIIYFVVQDARVKSSFL